MAESESEEDAGGEVDPNSVFLEEVTESMERIRTFDFSPELVSELRVFIFILIQTDA